MSFCNFCMLYWLSMYPFLLFFLKKKNSNSKYSAISLGAEQSPINLWRKNTFFLSKSEFFSSYYYSAFQNSTQPGIEARPHAGVAILIEGISAVLMISYCRLINHIVYLCNKNLIVILYLSKNIGIALQEPSILNNWISAIKWQSLTMSWRQEMIVVESWELHWITFWTRVVLIPHLVRLLVLTSSWGSV